MQGVPDNRLCTPSTLTNNPCIRCMVESMLVSEHALWWLAEGAGAEWKMEVLGAPLCSDVAMAPTSALGACPQSRPKR